MNHLFILISSFWLFGASAVDVRTVIKVPNKVQAGTPFQASIQAKLENGNTTYCDSVRVFLETYSEDRRNYLYDAEPQGYIVHQQSLCDPTIQVVDDYVFLQQTPFTADIPATVAPSGRHFVLMAQLYNTDGSWYGNRLESNVFELSGANGTTSNNQTEGNTKWGKDGLPFSSFSCVKRCAGKPNYNACANDCPGVKVDFNSTTRAGEPTASLTTPTACSLTQTSSTVEATGTTPSGSNPQGTESARSGPEATGTSAASVRYRFPPAFFHLLMSLVIVFAS